jgi:glucokinase
MPVPEPSSALAHDRRVVITLDAGGTSFRFNAIQGGRLLLDPIRVPTAGADLAACLDQLVAGFEAAQRAVGGEAVALSFAFPGPADYAAGIIGDLPNLTGFRGGVPLGPMLEARFGLPVFVNNDGALFTYGEALGGFLPWVNAALAAAGSARRYRNLAGFTLGTGFGGGLVVEGRLVRGDTSTAAQVWKLRHRDVRRCFVEEGVSIRAVRRAYAEAVGLAPDAVPEPRDIAAVAEGRAPGDAAAARRAFEELGRVAGDAVAQVLTLVDGLVVLGGGLSAAAPLFLPALLAEVNGTLEWHDGRLATVGASRRGCSCGPATSPARRAPPRSWARGRCSCRCGARRDPSPTTPRSGPGWGSPGWAPARRPRWVPTPSRWSGSRIDRGPVRADPETGTRGRSVPLGRAVRLRRKSLGAREQVDVLREGARPGPARGPPRGGARPDPLRRRGGGAARWRRRWASRSSPDALLPAGVLPCARRPVDA